MPTRSAAQQQCAVLRYILLVALAGVAKMVTPTAREEIVAVRARRRRMKTNYLPMDAAQAGSGSALASVHPHARLLRDCDRGWTRKSASRQDTRAINGRSSAAGPPK
ncbi:hypothetical protein C8Q73DRAFT_686958 [Cubamyces lactineus]|nr:hypothetical protein C8Q73DRAFT_686958 [Cubamyces lactineus]